MGNPVSTEQDEEAEEEEEIVRHKPSSLAELKRKQSTAVIILGVIGAEFGQDISIETSASVKKASSDLKQAQVK